MLWIRRALASRRLLILAMMAAQQHDGYAEST